MRKIYTMALIFIIVGVFICPKPGYTNETLRLQVGTEQIKIRINDTQKAVARLGHADEKEQGSYPQGSPQAVFSLLSDGQCLTIEEIAAALRRSKRTIQKDLDFLVSTAVIKEEGKVYIINPILKGLVSVDKIQHILDERFKVLKEGWRDEEAIRQEIIDLIPTKELIDRLDVHKRYYMEIDDAVYTLGILKREEAVEPLINLLNYHIGRDWDIVIDTTAEALGRIGDPRAKYPLGRLLQNHNDWIRKTAKAALMQIDPSFYYGIQRERILCTLFARDLEILIQSLEGEYYDIKLFEKVYDRLQKGHTFYELREIVEKTGGIKSWKETLEEMRKREITVSEVPQKDLPPNQICNITYHIPEAHFRNNILLYEDFEARLEQIFNLLSQMKVGFLRGSLPYRERTIEKPPWADSDDDSWMHEQSLYEQMSNIDRAFRYILSTGFDNSVDAVFKYIKDAGIEGVINLSVELKDGNLVAYISDNGAGLDLQKLQKLASGVKYESDKGKLSKEDFGEIDTKIREREQRILVSYDLEKANIAFGHKESQVGGHGRGIHQSAALLAAYEGTMKIDTSNKNGQKLVLVFGEQGLSDSINEDLELPVPVGMVRTGKRLSMGTTYIVSIPLKSSRSVLSEKLTELGVTDTGL